MEVRSRGPTDAGDIWRFAIMRRRSDLGRGIVRPIAVQPLTGWRWQPYRERRQPSGSQPNRFQARVTHSSSS